MAETFIHVKLSQRTNYIYRESTVAKIFKYDFTNDVNLTAALNIIPGDVADLARRAALPALLHGEHEAVGRVEVVGRVVAPVHQGRQVRVELVGVLLLLAY